MTAWVCVALSSQLLPVQRASLGRNKGQGQGEKVKFIDNHNDKDKDKDKYNDEDEDKDWKKQDMIKNIV